ncbi:MAG: hypothetical protein GQ539_01885 [Sulfitobacter sp.]|nr:hypothetical protein [Sulfitobacter sp.]
MRLTRCFALSYGLLAGFSGIATAQDAGSAAAGNDVYDPKVFLESMVSYRSLALTCEDVIPGSPMSDSGEVLSFFTALGMAEPLAIDQKMQRITTRLVRAQSASICTEKLQDRAVRYGELAVEYTTKRPKSWPEAPRILSGPWCRSESCSELSY